MTRSPAHHEVLTAAKFGAVGCVGFITDVTLLKFGLQAGLSPLAARVISLTCAMQITFLINGLLVFRCLKAASFLRQWTAYMSANGLGNICNYLIFAGLVVSGTPLVSRHYVALVIGSLSAYVSTMRGAGCWCSAGPRAPEPASAHRWKPQLPPSSQYRSSAPQPSLLALLLSSPSAFFLEGPSRPCMPLTRRMLMASPV
jgi:putative flippase GtrA